MISSLLRLIIWRLGQCVLLRCEHPSSPIWLFPKYRYIVNIGQSLLIQTHVISWVSNILYHQSLCPLNIIHPHYFCSLSIFLFPCVNIKDNILMIHHNFKYHNIIINTIKVPLSLHQNTECLNLIPLFHENKGSWVSSMGHILNSSTSHHIQIRQNKATWFLIGIIILEHRSIMVALITSLIWA